MTKVYDIALSEIIKERLTQLEAKPKAEAKVSARRIIEQFREAARQAMAKGYTLEEIRQIAQEAGLEVSLSTLKTYLRSRKVKKRAVAEPRPVTSKPSSVKADVVEKGVETPAPEPALLSQHAGFNEDN